MGKWKIATFTDVLTIINGKNQKQVENPYGRYPIYGSGGVMGYANDYLCEANTVVIGRKGTINKPIFVEEPFWNVDTAFGLRANDTLLFPKYLFYFCEKYDFESLNTTVTIPSLTKANLLKIEIPLPPLDVQQKIADALDKASALIELRQAQLNKLDLLIKSQFIEMFGDPVTNPKGLGVVSLSNIADIVSGITKGRKTKETNLREVPYMAVSNVKDGYIDWTTVKTIAATQAEIDQYRLLPDDILMTEGGDPDKVGRGAIIRKPLRDCIHQNHIFRVRLDESVVLPFYFAEYLKHPKAKQYFLGCAKQTTGIASINMKQLKSLPVLLPSLISQTQYADFVQQVDKLKQTIQQSLFKLELSYQSLMQKCFRGDLLE